MKAEETAHLGPEDFYGFIEKTLKGARLRAVQEHLDRCAECVGDLAAILGSGEPGSAAEEAALARVGVSPSVALEKLRPQIIASAPGPASAVRTALAWRRLLPMAAGLVVAAVVISVVNAFVISPARGRNLAARALLDLVRSRQSTGRVPLRYIRGFERARVTRSSFDAEDPFEEEAIKARLQKALTLAPRAAEPRLALGLFHLDRGELDEAEKNLRTALDIDPRSVDARNGLAVLCFQRFQRGQGESWLNRGVELLESARREYPRDAQVLYNLGMFRKAMGEPAPAQQAFREYLSIDPSSEWSRMAREYLGELEPSPRQ